MTKKKKKKEIRREIPEEFVVSLAEAYGQSLADDIVGTLSRKPTTFRVNSILSSHDEVVSELRRSGFEFDTVPWHDDVFILRNKTKRELIDSPLYESGRIYVQSLASMIPPIILAPMPGESVLDLTAAPGSKTSQIAGMMGMRGELVANDNNRIRFFKLKHNMEKLGVATPREDWRFTLRMEAGNALVWEYPEYFDRILLDAPCSGEARFDTRNPKTFAYWSPRKIREMAFKQRKLLLSAWRALKPGGTLVYSTCTMSPEENELQINLLLERYPDARLEEVAIAGMTELPIVRDWHGKHLSGELDKCLRIMPTADMESFFVVRVRKSLVSDSE
jgi:tRNA (cytosine49-C5)-methyltransferase